MQRDIYIMTGLEQIMIGVGISVIAGLIHKVGSMIMGVAKRMSVLEKDLAVEAEKHTGLEARLEGMEKSLDRIDGRIEFIIDKLFK